MGMKYSRIEANFWYFFFAMRTAELKMLIFIFFVFSSSLQKRIQELSNRAEKILGHSILLSSPQKVSQALFVELGLSFPGLKGKSARTSTKHQSTSEAILQGLKSSHPLPSIILGSRQLDNFCSFSSSSFFLLFLEEFRHCQKLLTTYVEPLEKKSVQSKEEGLPRIHTQWGHTSTATGRLASSNPNLQNIPKIPLSVKLDDELDSQQVTINIREGFCSKRG